MSGRALDAVDLRLAVPVAAGWAALGLLESLRPDAPAVICGLLAGALLAAAAAVLRRPGTGRSMLALLAVSLAVSALLAIRWEQTPAPPAEEPGRCQVILRLDSGSPLPAGVTVLEGACRTGPARGPAVLMPDDDAERPPGASLDPAALGFGTTVRASCETWLFQGSWMLRCGDVETLQQPPYARLSAQWRQAFADASAPLPGDGGALLAGLAIGDTARVEESLELAMLDAGLSHLTAVSGSNCAIVTASAFGVAAALGARRWLRVVTAAAALLAFVILVTPEPSVTRASLMAVIALAGLVRGQPRGAVPLLALAVLVGLLVHPPLAVSVGFVLSVLATAGLILHARPLAALLERWLPRPLAMATAVPAAAQLWCLPALIVLDSGVQPLSVLWNMSAAPAAPIVTIVGLVACLASQAVPVIGTAVAWFAWPAAAWIAGIARLSARLPEWRIPWAEGAVGAGLAAAALFGIALLLRRRRAGAVVLVAATTLAWLLAVVPAQLARAALGDWRVVQCDVGQGHATLVRSAGAVMLVDTGEHADLLQECLDLVGVHRVDLLVLTHFDRDHAGAAEELLGRASVVAHGPVDEWGAVLLDRLAGAGAELAQLAAGDSVRLGGATVEVLWPQGAIEPGNAASIVLAVAESGSPSVILLGDTGEREQRRLRQHLPRAEIVLAAHHCSADQDPSILSAAAPQIVLVGVGENAYGHPTQRCLDAIAAAGAAALRTDELGTVAIMGDGSVWTQHAP